MSELQPVVPAGGMNAEVLSKHIQARHSGPFEDVSLTTIAIPQTDLKVWLAYHAREHRVYPEEHDHFHRGESDDQSAEKASP